MKNWPNKYGAVRTAVDGITFASKREAGRYSELKLLERAGEIAELTLQPKFPIWIDGVKVCTYIADFRYVDLSRGITVIEDVKGMRTPVYKIKKKLTEALYPGVKIEEIS